MSLAMTVMFIIATQLAAAAWRLGAIVGSKTEVWNVGMSVRCAADTWTIAVPASLDVDNGDSVSIWHRAWWWDNRTNANAPTAYHNFTLDVDYQGTTYPRTYPATTHSQESGSATLNVTVTVQQNTYLFINWSASVIVPGLGGCTASESGYPVQKVYLG